VQRLDRPHTKSSNQDLVTPLYSSDDTINAASSIDSVGANAATSEVCTGILGAFAEEDQTGIRYIWAMAVSCRYEALKW
jgi:hypothetical protein